MFSIGRQKSNALVIKDDCQTALDAARVKGFSKVVRVIEDYTLGFTGLCYFLVTTPTPLSPFYMASFPFSDTTFEVTSRNPNPSKTTNPRKTTNNTHITTTVSNIVSYTAFHNTAARLKTKLRFR